MEKKISQYDLVSSIDGTESIPVSKGGLPKRATPAQINTYIQTIVDTKISEIRNPRVDTAPTGATWDLNIDTHDCLERTALSSAVSSVTITGTAENFRRVTFRFKDDGTSCSLTWGGDFKNIGVALPSSTTTGKWHTIEMEYNETLTKWCPILALVEP